MARPETQVPPPSKGAYAALGPYARTRLTVHALGQSLGLDVPGDVFSTQRIDEGTQLLLSHLPQGEPRSVLDLGCGYGALGLPVAARFPKARMLLVDRDLLAVSASGHNAKALSLGNVEARPSLGFRGLTPSDVPFSWVLCNVPARIGKAAIGAFLERGRALLAPGGELRVVVIRDLVPVTESESQARGLPLVRVVDGPRHTVFALPALAGAQPEAGPAQHAWFGAASAIEDDAALYARDRTALTLPKGQTLEIARPHDASEDPQHAQALALLFETLPSKPVKSALTFRCGFGGAALALLSLQPEVRVLAQERDLLDAAFLRVNARALGLDARLEVRETLFPLEAARGVAFPLVVGELSPSAGPAVLARELKETAALLSPGGEARVLVPSKALRQELNAAAPKKSSFSVLLERGPTSVVRLAAPRS
ncbi:MAG: methyltransferase [Deltaproteobacteria bacterium]|nr:methyltransferase [Deltaproteobacteria bacterium]